MQRTVIFRIEVDGVGVYRSRAAWIMYDHDHKAIYEYQQPTPHPSPEQDSALEWQYGQTDYYFGFGSMEQFNRWVYSHEMRQQLHDAGAVLVMYSTDDYSIGNTQAVFRKATAIRVGEAPLV